MQLLSRLKLLKLQPRQWGPPQFIISPMVVIKLLCPSGFHPRSQLSTSYSMFSQKEVAHIKVCDFGFQLSSPLNRASRKQYRESDWEETIIITKSPSPTPTELNRSEFFISFPLNCSCCCWRETRVWKNQKVQCKIKSRQKSKKLRLRMNSNLYFKKSFHVLDLWGIIRRSEEE